MCNPYLMKSATATCSCMKPQKRFYCRVILERRLLWDFWGFFFLKFHFESRLPTSKCVFPRVSRELSRHPGAPQKLSCFPVLPSSIPNPDFCCREMRMAARGTKRRTELPAGRVWARHGPPRETGAVGTSVSPAFWACSSLRWWALLSALTKSLCAGYK